MSSHFLNEFKSLWLALHHMHFCNLMSEHLFETLVANFTFFCSRVFSTCLLLLDLSFGASSKLCSFAQVVPTTLQNNQACKRAKSYLRTWMTSMSSPARGKPGHALTSSLRASESIAESRPMRAIHTCTKLATGHRRLECTSSGTKSGTAAGHPASAGSPRWAYPLATWTTRPRMGAPTRKG